MNLEGVVFLNKDNEVDFSLKSSVLENGSVGEKLKEKGWTAHEIKNFKREWGEVGRIARKKKEREGYSKRVVYRRYVSDERTGTLYDIVDFNPDTGDGVRHRSILVAKD